MKTDMTDEMTGPGAPEMKTGMMIEVLPPTDPT